MSSKSDYSTGVKPRKLDFPFYWRSLVRNKWPIALFTALMTIGAICYTLVTKSIYSAEATLLLESQSASVSAGQNQVLSKDKSLEYVSTQTAILKSRMLAERVIQQIDNGRGATSTNSATSFVGRDHKDYNEQVEKFRKSIRIKPIAKTKLIRIRFESDNPEYAALVANTVANEYIKSDLDRRSAFKDNTSAWMNERVEELKSKLENSEDELLDFREKNGLLDLNGGVGRLNEQELLTTSSELAEVNSELSASTDLLRKIRKFKVSSPKLLETLPFIQNDPLVRSVQTQIGQVQLTLNELSNRYGPKHPQIVDANGRLNALRSEQSGHISRAVATFENDYQLLSQRVSTLKSKLENGINNFQVLGKKRIALESLENEVISNREQYKELYDKILDARAKEGLDEANSVVSETAWVPTTPIKPRKLFIVGLVFLASLLFAAALSALLEFLNDTVTSTKDIEGRLKTRLLGVLPLIDKKRIPKKKGRKNDLPIGPKDVASASDTFAEAVNTCRTALSMGNRKYIPAGNRRNIESAQEYTVILVTSSEPDEGKSTVALNLAHSFGRLERTLLIDCDLRKPSIAKALGISADSVGLSSLLTEKPPVKNFIKHNVLDSFDCMTSGPISDQPQEMLASDKFETVLKFLRVRYDRIIIDCAPTHVVSDAMVLSKLVDGIVYVVKPHKTPIKLIYSGLSRLTDAGATIAGVCLSQVDINKSNSYGGMEFHGFGVNYQYGNHYSNINHPEKPSKLTQVMEQIPNLKKAS